MISDHWQVVERGVVNGVYEVTFDCDFAWKTNDDAPMLLFKRNNRMTYAWNPGLNEFLFDRSRSTATEEELRRVYPEWDVGFNKSLRLYIRELDNLARNGDQKQKNWLKDYLQYVGDDPYQGRLLRALRN